MTNLKKVMSIATIGALMLGMVACGAKQEEPAANAPANAATETTNAPAEEATTEEATEATNAPAEEATETTNAPAEEATTNAPASK